MKRIKNRRKHFRISNPLGFSLFCAMIILIAGLIVGVVFLARGGYFKQMLNCVRAEVNGDRSTPTQVVEETNAPEASKVPTAVPTETAEETPEIGTPVPETPTPPPLAPETQKPEETGTPTKDPNAPLAGFTIGIDPTRDGNSKYKSECEYNLEFAKQLGEYLESKGATVVITRDNNSKELSNSKRAKIIKNAKCDIALRIICNHISSKSSGCYVRTSSKNKSYGKMLIDNYSSMTGIKKQSGKKSGLEIKSDDVASNCGCPCVRLVLGNWSNKSERSNLEDDAFRDKMIQAIYETLLSQLKK